MFLFRWRPTKLHAILACGRVKVDATKSPIRIGDLYREMTVEEKCRPGPEMHRWIPGCTGIIDFTIQHTRQSKVLLHIRPELSHMVPTAGVTLALGARDPNVVPKQISNLKGNGKPNACRFRILWWRGGGSNSRPWGYESHALTI